MIKATEEEMKYTKVELSKIKELKEVIGGKTSKSKNYTEHGTPALQSQRSLTKIKGSPS